VPAASRVLLAEAFRMAASLADSIWPGWGGTPFEVVLVTDEHEFLIHSRRDPAPEGFEALPDDPVLGPVRVRPRQFSPALLATFPAFGLPPTVVVGVPERTGKRPNEWVITLLHEHFHQRQWRDSAYLPAIAALGLARGDESGMWMLNFPFPYDNPGVQRRAAALALALAGALRAGPTDSFPPRVQRVPMALTAFVNGLSDDDRKYFWFQIWQEGVSRYVEVVAAEWAARAHTPGPEFRALPDVRPYAEVAQDLRATIVTELERGGLGEQRRAMFYPLGAALALVLDRTDPAWRRRYFAQRFQPLH
jgi:hypothetical protein